MRFTKLAPVTDFCTAFLRPVALQHITAKTIRRAKLVFLVLKYARRRAEVQRQAAASHE